MLLLYSSETNIPLRYHQRAFRKTIVRGCVTSDPLLSDLNACYNMTSRSRPVHRLPKVKEQFSTSLYEDTDLQAEQKFTFTYPFPGRLFQPIYPIFPQLKPPCLYPSAILPAFSTVSTQCNRNLCIVLYKSGRWCRSPQDRPRKTHLGPHFSYRQPWKWHRVPI